MHVPDACIHAYVFNIFDALLWHDKTLIYRKVPFWLSTQPADPSGALSQSVTLLRFALAVCACVTISAPHGATTL